jgi:3-phosphoshikimate 1-carboxyvinyltransferase
LNSYSLKHDNSFFSRSFEISGSKSESNRLLILKSFYRNLEIENLSDSDDSVVLSKHLKNLSNHIDIGHAGTAMRFLTAFLSIQNNKEFEITGSERMKQRPIKILVDALNSLGADIRYKDKVGYPPLIIRGKKISRQKISLSAEISSQYISALILIAPFLDRGLLIHLEGTITSRPYLEMTLSILNKIGVTYEFTNNKITIEPLTEIDKTTINVESDWSSVSYFYSIVALANKSELSIGKFYNSSIQGDKELSKIYLKFGVETEFLDAQGRIILKKIKDFVLPQKVSIDLTKHPDIAQTIAVTCFGLGISCDLFGLHTLKIKETDRLLALKIELEKLGAEIEITNNSIHLSCCSKINENISIDTYNDHRMAMAFAPLAILVPLKINNPDVVSKSYKNFWSDLKAINFNISG